MKFSVGAALAFLCLASLAGLMSSPSAVAQVAGQNVNMVSGTQWPTGDPFLQRQNEPSMAVSTRNPMHILAGANDYRSVDLQMVLTGGEETGDAWLGIFKSFDGGYTWQSNLLPGCPYNVPQCVDSGALHGTYQAGADPVVRAGTNGMFYFAGLAFDRATSATTASSVSTVFVARYNDLNNNEQLDPITYIDTHIVATGNSSQFLDKPSMAVDIPRAGASTCSFTANEPGVGPNGGTLAVKQSFAAGNVYVAYTDFLAGTKANSTPTHLMFTHSTDCGVTWSTPIQVNTGTTTSQGSAIAVNPLTGAVYVAWRQFASTGVSDAIMIAQSTNAGKTFNKPVQISTFQPFDQGTTLTSFRTNAYPALTTDMFGFVYVAFSARGLSSSGDARIVAAGSIDGTHWTPPIMVDNPGQNAQTNPSGRGHQIMPAMTFANGRLTLLYYDLRLDHYAGFYTPNPASLGNYTEMLEPQGELAAPSPQPNLVFTPYIDDANLTLRRHTLDLRVLELGIFPTVTLGPSVLLSQYEYGCCVNPETEDIEQFKFNVPNLPLFDSGQEAFLGDYIDIVPSPMFVPSGSSWAYNFMPSVNPLFHATWTDNRDVVPPPPGGSWENYTAPVVAGAISVENGQPLPPCVPGQEGMRNQNIYTAQVTGGLVVGAPGNAKPFGTTTFNGQTYPFQRAFPVEAQNTTAQPLNVRFTITNQPTGGTASFLQFSKLTTLDVTIPAYSSVSRSVFATSTNAAASVSVTVAQITAIGGSVVSNGLSSTAVLNPDITNPNITNPNITNPNITNDEVTNPNITNPNITNPNIANPSTANPNITNPNITNSSYLNPNITNPNITNLNVTNVSATNPNITNPDITNPNITNPNITNPNITNPNITNPDITNGSIQDVIYPVTNNGNTTASYTVKTATGATIPGGIVLQMIINKLYQTPVAENCVLGVQTHWITVANITNPKLFSVADPNLTNPDITNSTPNEATVTLAPGETAYITLRVVNPTPALTPFNPLTVITPVTVPQAVNTTTVLANPGNPNLTAPPVYPPMSILTATLPPTDQNEQGYSFQLQSSGGKPGTDTWSLVSTSVQGVNVSSSGLLTAPALPLGPNSITVQVADSATPQNTALKTFSILVSNAFMPNVPSRFNDGVVGQSYVGSSFTTTGGTSPITWTATGLPAGLSLSSTTGQFTQVIGAPTVANPGGTVVQLTATDSASPPVALSASVTIRVGAVIQITPATLPSGTLGVAYSANLGANGGIPGTAGSYTFGLQTPVTGVSLDSSGQLTIANPQSSSISFSVSVHDQSNLGTTPGFQFQTANYTILFAAPVGGNVTFVQQPPNYIAGQTNPNSPVVVHVQDATAAPIANANVTMSLFGTPPCSTATLSGTLTQATEADGNAFFTDLNVNRGQNGFLLNANVQGISAQSNPFNVSGFCDTGSMNTARRNHMVIALPNGKILVTGGAANADGSGVLASAELYDPVAHTFMTVGPMTAARADHTMTLLLNGKVLITGGFNDTDVIASAELFDPSSNAFTAVPVPMTTPRAEHTATLLANGTVLITGGNNDNGVSVNSAEIYDPVANTFTATANVMNSVRQAHHADLLPNGQVLISGGLDSNNNALASAEIFDPVAGTFTLTGNMTTARGNHSSALLYNGQILVAGGLTGPGTALVLTPTAELYNPSTGAFTPTANMSIARGHYAGIVLGDGTIFISGGATLPAGTNADIYNPATQTFSTTGNFTMVQTGGREAVAPDGTVLLASGVNNASPAVTVPNSELFYPPTVAPGIVVTNPTSLPNAMQNAPYTQLLLEHGGIGLITWTPVSLPTGLTLTSNGILTGTPTQSGTFDVAVTVTDTSTPPQTQSVTFSLTIAQQFAITTPTLPNGTEGTAYSATISTTGGTPPISFSITQSNFPPGLTITQPPVTSTTDTLAGTPTLAGNYTFSESVADSGSPTEMATQNYSVTVLPQPPTNLTGSPQTTSIITLTWNASAAQDITGYRIHYGTSSGVYTTTISAGNVNQYVVMGLSTATTYYFVVDTISTSGVESVFSNEVAVATQQPSP
ncbi:MAG: kelch repeat-containing protein [Candidatus Acidiferrum sp.]